MTESPGEDASIPPTPPEPGLSTLGTEYDKKLRRRMENRLRQAREPLLRVARLLNIR